MLNRTSTEAKACGEGNRKLKVREVWTLLPGVHPKHSLDLLKSFGNNAFVYCIKTSSVVLKNLPEAAVRMNSKIYQE